MMKRAGYEPHEAAAIETAAGTGGAVMPPVMGAGVFIMSELTGIPLATILLYSFFRRSVLRKPLRLRAHQGKEARSGRSR